MSASMRRPDVHLQNIDHPGGVQRRRRGAARLSCAECRRLKLRCDRKVPCESCVKRGCAAICPDGSLTTGKGNRFVLASTQELHEKISELCCRVRELEDALRESHASLSRDVHPLLTEELLKIKAPLQREPNSDRDPVASGGIKEEPTPDVVDSFGSLSITNTGKTKFYGHTANSWYFLQNEELEEDQAEDRSQVLETILPPEILALGSAFPTSPTNSPIARTLERFNNLVGYLPDIARAAELRDIYYQRAAWMYNPVTREQFNEEVFPNFYSDSYAPPSPPSPNDSASSHRLALMFIILAFGTLMDPALPRYNLEAEKYHQLARAALFKSAIFEDPTLHAVQALFLMSNYLFLADRHGTGSGSRWVIMGFAVKLAQSIGLHRDSTKWGMLNNEKETLIRRVTFWELYTYDSWQCLTFGRPPSFSLSHVDCKFPHPTEDPSGEISFDTWKHRFSAECMSIVHDQAFGAKTPSYQTILQLDRKLRAFPVPPVLQIAGFGNSGSNSETSGAAFACVDTLGLIMQRHIVLAIREMNLLYMHRGFFARAISDNPKDPLGSAYGTSVIAAYRSAGSLVALLRNLDTQLPEPTERLWFLWTHLFSCAVVLGTIVTRCPSMSLAPSALVQLDSACELFEKVAITFRATKVLMIMKNLQHKAHISLVEFREGRQSPLTSVSPFRSMLEGTPELNDDDELSKLGGKTRLISQKDLSKSPSPQVVTRSPNTHNPIVPLPLPDASMGVHPSVVEYLSTFNFGGPQQQQNGREAGVGAGQQLYVPAQDQTMYPATSPVNASGSGGPFSLANGGGGPGAMHFHPNVELHAQTHNLTSAAEVLAQAQTSPTSAGSSGMHSLVVDPSPQHSPVQTRGPYVPITHNAHVQLQQQQKQQQQQQQQYFPQYFPVFDYGSSSNGTDGVQGGYGQAQSLAAGANGVNGTTGGRFDHGHAMVYEPGPGSAGPDRSGYANGGMNGSHDRRESLTPETSVHTAWMDFVSQMSMNM